MKLASLAQVVLSAVEYVGVGRHRPGGNPMTAADVREARYAVSERWSHFFFSVLTVSCMAVLVGLCGVPLLLILAVTGLIAWSTWGAVIGVVVALAFLAWGAAQLGGWFFKRSGRHQYLDGRDLNHGRAKAADPLAALIDPAGENDVDLA